MMDLKVNNTKPLAFRGAIKLKKTSEIAESVTKFISMHATNSEDKKYMLLNTKNEININFLSSKLEKRALHYLDGIGLNDYIHWNKSQVTTDEFVSFAEKQMYS